MSGKIKKAEEFVYAAVRSGELTIDSRGRIWRVAARRGNRWTGDTFSVPCPRRRAERGPTDGYRNVRAMIDGKRMTALAHRLVWLHFKGSIPDGLTINHENGIKHDNRPRNLSLATDSEQQIHAIHILKRGRTVDQWSEKNSAAKLSNAAVKEILALRKKGKHPIEIAKQFEITWQHVYRIISKGTRRFG